MQNKDLNILVTLPAEARHRRRIEAACPGGNFRYVRQEALTPEDVADVIALLAEPGTRFLTGQIIGIDGGLVI